MGGKHEKKGHLKDYYKIDEYKDGYEYGEKKDDKKEYKDGYEYGEKKDDKKEYKDGYEYGEKKDDKKEYEYGYEYGEKKDDKKEYAKEKKEEKYKKTVYLEKDKDFYEKYKEDGYDASGVEYIMKNLDWDKVCE